MAEEIKGEGFIAKDTDSTAGTGQATPEPSENAPPLPEVNFSTFILSLSSSVLFHFGTIPDPVTNEINRNLQMAKQTIDILGLLQEKTRGNLSKDESALLENLLYDLRLRYVEELKKGPSEAPPKE